MKLNKRAHRREFARLVRDAESSWGSPHASRLVAKATIRKAITDGLDEVELPTREPIRNRNNPSDRYARLQRENTVRRLVRSGKVLRIDKFCADSFVAQKLGLTVEYAAKYGLEPYSKITTDPRISTISDSGRTLYRRNAGGAWQRYDLCRVTSNHVIMNDAVHGTITSNDALTLWGTWKEDSYDEFYFCTATKTLGKKEIADLRSQGLPLA